MWDDEAVEHNRNRDVAAAVGWQEAVELVPTAIAPTGIGDFEEFAIVWMLLIDPGAIAAVANVVAGRIIAGS